MVEAQTRWRLRDWLAGFGLFTVTAAVILWQNAHVAVLWDLSYVLDSATRIALGQTPYRDFPFAHAPLTFLIQAAIIRLTGRVFFHHVLYAAIVGGLSTVLTWRITLRILRDRVSAASLIALVLAAPLTVLGIYCILPLPSYDCDCAFAMLVAIWLVVSIETPFAPGTRGWRAVLAGIALCLPLFFKQNIGLAFLAAAGAVILVVLAASRFRQARTLANGSFRICLLMLAGAAAALLAAALLIHFTVGLGNYIHWTIGFAAQRRLPGLQQMLGVYNDPQLLWTLPCIAVGLVLLRNRLFRKRWATFLTVALFAAPFVYTLRSLVIYDDADERGDSLLALWPMLLILAAVLALRNLRFVWRQPSFRALLPIVLLIAIHGTLMSQQLWGSTYAIWPLLILLVAEMIAYLAQFSLSETKPEPVGKSVAEVMAAIAALTLVVCGGFYTASEERLSYVKFPDGPVAHSSFPQLKGLSTPGPFLPDLDELLHYVSTNIPRNDGIILIPGEDPFYFVTDRVPQFPVLLFDPATDPYSPDQVHEEAQKHNIRWLIVKRDLQINEDPTPQRDATLTALARDFILTSRLHGYDIYRSEP